MKKYILLYDGDCGFCNFWVKWILDKDRKGLFNFASLQGKFAQGFLKEKHLPLNAFDTLYLIHPDGTVEEKSDAVIRIGRLLGGWYKAAVIFKLLPKYIRDKMYSAVANNRKKMMAASCPMPTREQRKLFLD